MTWSGLECRLRYHHLWYHWWDPEPDENSMIFLSNTCYKQIRKLSLRSSYYLGLIFLCPHPTVIWFQGSRLISPWRNCFTRFNLEVRCSSPGSTAGKKVFFFFFFMCHKCQLTDKHNQTLKPVLLCPAISQPFEYLMVDCVGPLPSSKSGATYHLTVTEDTVRMYSNH